MGVFDILKFREFELLRKLVTTNKSGASSAQLYDARVMATSPLRYNKLNEASGTAIVDSSGNAYTGTYTGVILANTDSPFAPDDAPFWDGTNDYGDLYSAAFAAALNLDEFTVMLWVKMNSAGVWTDAATRYLLRLRRDANNLIDISKAAFNNTIQFNRIGNGTAKPFSVGSQSDTDFFCVALTCSVAGGGLLGAGEMRGYKNGVQIGATQTANVADSGSGLATATVTLGASSTAGGLVHHGWLSNLMIWNRPIDAAILALMTA